MGVAENFKTFCGGLVVKNKDSIRLRYTTITKRINADYWGTVSDSAHSLYVGSYGRNTGINGISDIDMLVELPNAVYHKFNKYTSNGQSAMLQDVRSSIAKTYPTSKVGGDGQVVSILFTDGITFEILPAFVNQDGKSYTYADANSGGNWKVTRPRAEIQAMREKNQACNDNLKWLCRMMRVWKQQNGVPITSFLIDTLAYQFIGNWQYRDKSFLYFDYLTRDFLEFLATRYKDQSHWLAPGSGQHVFRIGKFESYASVGYRLAQTAIQLELDKKKSSARLKWREIYGSRYP